MATDNEAGKNRRSKLVYTAVIAVLVVFFIVGFTYGLNSVLKMEGSFPPVVLTEGLTPAPETKEAAAAYVNAVVEKAVAGAPGFSADAWFEIDGDSLSSDGADALNSTLGYLREDFAARLNENEPSAAADFSEGFSSLIRKPQITVDEIKDVTCDYIYYSCSACGETSAEPQQSCEACGSEYPYQMQYRDNYTLTIELYPSEAVLDRNFTHRSDAEIRALLGGDLESVADVKEIGVEYESLILQLSARRETDELQSLKYIKKMPVTASASFIGPYSVLGDVRLSMRIEETERYSFTWPALVLSKHTLDMEPKGADNLLATLICDDPTVYDAVWTSSDENIVAVDEEGYLKAAKTPGTAVITATFEFKGKSYSDSCVVNVKYDVESLSLNKRKITVNAGDTYALKATVSPKKATIQTVTWYTEDESIATVDENGVVKAVSPGTVIIYALSDDLFFKSSCEVTVK